MSELLSLSGFGLAFESRVILRNVNLELSSQGCTVLLGPSGTGKSTLLRTLAGLLATHARIRLWGRVLYQGRPWHAAEGSRPALVEQKPQLLVSSVWDNLALELPERGQKTRIQQMEEIGAFLAQMGQNHLMDQLEVPVIDLPVPQQRIVAILRKAMAVPGLLMVDEPTTNLKDEDAAEINVVLKELATRIPLLVVSHHQGHTRQIADHIVLVANGMVQEAAETERFFNDPQSESARHFLRSGSCPEVGAGQLEEVLAEIGQFPELIEQPVQDPPPVAVEAPVPRIKAIESYPSASRGPRGFVWLLGGLVAGTPQPGVGVVNEISDDLEALQAVGVKRLISLTEAPFASPLMAQYGIEASFNPIPDMHPPSLSQAVQLCREIDLYCTRGEAVAVHCKAGLGRTGTILAAYWIWHHQGKIKGRDAVAHIRRLEPRMIQSTEQEEFLNRFSGELRTMSLSFQDPVEVVSAAL